MISVLQRGEKRSIVRTNNCVHCNKGSFLSIDNLALSDYQAGRYAQHAFSDVDVDTRELIVSGTHAKCWDAMFPPEDDEDLTGNPDPSEPNSDYEMLTEQEHEFIRTDDAPPF